MTFSINDFFNFENKGDGFRKKIVIYGNNAKKIHQQNNKKDV